jgi:lauroyl/myristoyl acyltransferase
MRMPMLDTIIDGRFLKRILGAAIDERFLNHRLKSSSLGGIIYVNHFWSWDLFAVALTIVGVKLAVMAWYLITD